MVVEGAELEFVPDNGAAGHRSTAGLRQPQERRQTRNPVSFSWCSAHTRGTKIINSYVEIPRESIVITV